MEIENGETYLVILEAPRAQDRTYIWGKVTYDYMAYSIKIGEGPGSVYVPSLDRVRALQKADQPPKNIIYNDSLALYIPPSDRHLDPYSHQEEEPSNV